MLLNNKDTIVFVGDSVTDAGRKRPIGEGLWEGVGTGFVRQIDTLLNVLYPENRYTIYNMGCSGHNTRDLINRWENDVINLKPDVIVCEIGVNDVWRQFDEPNYVKNHVYIDEYKENLQKMIDISKDKCRQFIFMTPYFMELNVEDEMGKTVRAYASAMKEIASKNGIMCIDLQETFDDYLKYRHSAYLMWDRVHPGNIGSMLIAKTFLKAIGVDRNLI